MLRKLFLLLLVLAPFSLFSQVRYADYTWNTFPPDPAQDTVKSVNGSLILLERDIKEVFVNKEDRFEEIHVFHRKIRVDNATAISQFNKIFIPTDDVIGIIAIKARFISPTGKITELPEKSIRLIENLENKGDFQAFAIEGAEVGGQIEYFYVLREQFNAFGTVFKQDDNPRTNVDVILTYPANLEFLVKSYHGFPSFSKVSTSKDFIEQRATAAYIPAVEEERYSFYKANLQGYEYTLSYNHYNSTKRVYSWSTLASKLYELFYQTNKKEKAAVSKWLQSMKLDMTNQDLAIRKLENTVKSEITIVTSREQDIPLDEVIRTKQAKKLEMNRLFIALLNEAGIKFDLVSTSNREEHPFDPDFNGWNFMDVFFVYFPETGLYILPDVETHRYGPVLSSYQESYGMFCHPLSYENDLQTLGYEIRYIPAVVSNTVTDSILIKLQADPSKLSLTANVHRVFSGDLASSFQAFWNINDETHRKNLLKGIFGMNDPNVRIMDFTLYHHAPEDINVYPLTWDVKVVSDVLMESAGDDILVKIGETIGEQSELYQTGPRKLPVAIDILRGYRRRIEMPIPAGYHIDDISALKMNVSMMNNGKESCYFRSDAMLQGDLLIITSEENYSETFYPQEKFEEFRRVINAAADFNKKTVLLMKND